MLRVTYLHRCSVVKKRNKYCCSISTKHYELYERDRNSNIFILTRSCPVKISCFSDSWWKINFQLILMHTLSHMRCKTISREFSQQLQTHWNTLCAILWLSFLEVTLKQQEAGEKQRWGQPTFRIGSLLLIQPISCERWESLLKPHQSVKAGGKATQSAQLLLLMATVAAQGTICTLTFWHTSTYTHMHSVTQQVCTCLPCNLLSLHRLASKSKMWQAHDLTARNSFKKSFFHFLKTLKKYIIN